MSRMLRALALAAVLLVPAIPLLAEESADTQQVRELLNKESEGHLKGKPEQIISCFTPDAVMYWAMAENPSEWYIWQAGIDSLRVNYAAGATAMAAVIAKHPEWMFGNEVSHIHVMGDHAIATTKHWSVLPDSTTRETIYNHHQSVWMLEKKEGAWKIASVIATVTSEQKISKEPAP